MSRLLETLHTDRRTARRGAGLLLATAAIFGGSSAAIAQEPISSPSPIASPEVSPAPIEGFQINPGEVFQAQKGDLIFGDVVVGPVGTTVEQFLSNDPSVKVLYDTEGHKAADVENNADTGLITVMDVDGAVFTSKGWAAGGLRGVPAEQQELVVESYRQAMIKTGCNPEPNQGCPEGVDIIRWTGTETVSQGDIVHEGDLN